MFSGRSKGNIGKKRVKINQIRDILNFDDFTVPKIVLDNKVIKKTQTKKDQGNSAIRFGENYLTNYLVTFLQYKIK